MRNLLRQGSTECVSRVGQKPRDQKGQKPKKDRPTNLPAGTTAAKLSGSCGNARTRQGEEGSRNSLPWSLQLGNRGVQFRRGCPGAWSCQPKSPAPAG